MQIVPPDESFPTASLAALQQRAELMERVRTFFRARGYLEVETPTVSRETVIDRHLDPMELADEFGVRRFLQTSPELGMKRLLAAWGENAPPIFQLTRCYRAGEAGDRHNPEFTMVEWYRTGDSLDDAMHFTDVLVHYLLETPPAERLTYQEAFLKYAAIDPLKASLDELQATAARVMDSVPESQDPTDRDGWLDLILVSAVEPNLGKERPTILHEYPASQAALARLHPDRPEVAERFELYWAGYELANGYRELTNAEELFDRFVRQNELRQRDGKPPLPLPERLMTAQRVGLPDCSGVSLGLDRVVLLALGATSLAEVIALPWDRA